MSLKSLLEQVKKLLLPGSKKPRHFISSKGGIAPQIVVYHNPKGFSSEAYRSLKMNVEFVNLEKKVKSILITSATSGEGKTVTSANLAIAMAQMGSKTLLVDTDLRKPMLHKLFGVSKEPGMVNHLVHNRPLSEVTKTNEMENLYLITSGVIPPNPSGLLNSKAMEAFLEEVKESFDYVIFDSPPVLAVSDALILSSKVDAVFLVIKDGYTDRRACLRAKDMLEKASAKVAGAILNQVSVDNGYGGYYQYYYYYDYGYLHGDRQERRKRRRKRPQKE